MSKTTGNDHAKSAFTLWQVRINNCIFFQFSLIVVNNAPSNPIGFRQEVLAFAHEGMQQSAIAGHMGLTRAIGNRILWRRSATGTLVPGKSTTAVSAWSGHRRGRTWQWPIGSMSSSVTRPDSNFAQSMAGLGYVVYLESASSKDARLVWSKQVVVRHTSVKHFTTVQNRLLCSPTDTWPASSTGAFCETPYCHLPGSMSGITTTTETIMPHLTMLG